MENENKNENKNKGKHHRHKPYFISPASEQKESREVKSAEENVSAERKHNHNHRHKNKIKNTAVQSTESAPQAQATPAPSAAEANDKPQVSEKNRRHKNKSKRNSENLQKEPQSNTTEAAISADMQGDADSSFSKLDRLEKPAPKKLESFRSSPEYQKYQDYEEFTYEEIYGSLDEEPITAPTKPLEEEKKEETVNDAKIEVVGIRFKASGKTYYFAPNGITLRIGLHAIVETARGLEYGEVVMGNSMISESEIFPPLRPVIRAATQADTLHNEEIKKLEENAFRVCNEKIIAHGLDMKLIDAQYTFDNSKLLFYFTSAGRVDFRELVKDLASVFRTRIELRQIGIRDEAKMVGGLGICGRPLCCSKFLTDFGQVSIKMAKEQNLSLNSAKISGICGRLMCCLRYEHDTYEYEIKRTPPVDTLVRTVDGVGTVTEISPLQGTIKVRLAATPEVMPKSYRREEVTILKKKN